MTAQFIINELLSVASSEKAAFLQRFFKTGKGQYAEGDVFLGIVVPLTRNIAKANKMTPLPELQLLIESEYHEARLAALLIVAERFKKATPSEQTVLYNFYLRNTAHINNWDLVDVTCAHVVGSYLLDKDRSILYSLAKSNLFWEQRIAMVSTITFIRNKQYDDTLALAEIFLTHKHDLMHKAMGWMLREVGKRDKATLLGFLNRYASVMPRTSLRYAIEHFPPDERKVYMEKK